MTTRKPGLADICLVHGVARPVFHPKLKRPRYCWRFKDPFNLFDSRPCVFGLFREVVEKRRKK